MPPVFVSSTVAKFLKDVTERPMTDIVKERSELDSGQGNLIQLGLIFIVKVTDLFFQGLMYNSGEMRDTDAVVKSRMQRTRIDQVHCPKLFDIPESLEEF